MFSRCYRHVFLALAFAAVSAGWVTAGAEASERFFDAASDRGPEIRLAVFYPSAGKIRDLATLRESGLLSVPNLVVIGVYHEKERTDYGMSRKFVTDNRLDWFKFHPVSRPISPDVLFQKNECSPEFEAVARKSDGVIFLGGPDIPPSIYKEKTSLLTVIDDPYRHYFELSAIFHLLGGSQDDDFKGLLESRQEFPVLGICLGFQSLNVGTGGSLVQDIWTEVYGRDSVEDVLNIGPENWHNNPFARLHPQEKLTGYSLHTLNLDRDGKFVKEFGFRESDHPSIVSSHHQGLEKLGKGLRIISASRDGRIAEAVDHRTYPNILGVQFHPEIADIYNRDIKRRFSPRDKDGVTLMSLMEQNPPSRAFHQKIWGWFGEKLQECRKSRAE